MEDIKILSRNPSHYKRETKTELHPVHRNISKNSNPLETVREYQRALNAQKLERVMAKPFVGALEGHSDGVSIIARHPSKLNVLWSGSQDGQIRKWSLTSRKTTRKIQAHDGWVRGLAVSKTDKIVTVGVDKQIKLWEGDEFSDSPEIATIIGKSPFTSCDFALDESSKFITSSSVVEYWDSTRSDPIRRWQWGHDSYNRVKFNPVETDLACTTVSDKSVVLYDVRADEPMKKLKLDMQSNGISWNPQQAMLFTVANEDNNLYTFDIRNLASAFAIHVDHTDAVLDVDWSPTGRELVSASYDRTVRIFQQGKNRSRECYHIKRMQRVFSCAFSGDAQYLMCGSDEGNIRLWKTVAWAKTGVLNFRQKQSLQYSEALKKKFAHHNDVRRIARHRHLPKTIYKERMKMQTMISSRKRKERNLQAHSKPGAVEIKPIAERVVEETME